MRRYFFTSLPNEDKYAERTVFFFVCFMNRVFEDLSCGERPRGLLVV